MVQVAKVLSTTNDKNGNPIRVVLDRRVHGAGITHLGEWKVRGAICTVLEAESPDI